MIGLGAEQVVTDLSQVDEPVDLVLDNVGGPQLVAAWDCSPRAAAWQCIGWRSGEPAMFQPYSTVGAARPLGVTTVWTKTPRSHPHTR